jgi:hypothetical protein
MTFQQRKTQSQESFVTVPPDVALSASQYQRERAVEAKHLAVMASHNLVVEWSAETHAAVLEARVHIRAAREARAAFRREVAAFVRALRIEAVPLPLVLRQTRSMLQRLQSCGALEDDGGWLEAEVLEWAIEDYQALG